MSESNNQNGKLIGVEVSDSSFKAVCLDKNKNLADAFKISINDAQKTIPQLINFINQAKSRFGDFEKLGIAVPGLVHRQTGRVAFSTYIPEHEQVDFLSEIEAAANLQVTVENDANAAAYGEFLLGAGRGSRDIFYVTLGTGVGGALILDGKIWRGASGFAGEFGHIAVNSDGMKLEDVVSSGNIVRRTRNRFHQDHTSSLSRLPEEEIKLADVVQAAQREDDFAQMMLQRTGAYVGMAIASVINLLNIEKIVVGGEIMQAKHLVLDAIVSRAKELSFPPSFESTRIIEGELGENAAAVGAALLSNDS
ncbi:MAG: ROK family protein [Acidobacteria bacterium]|nr:ROK family protein [Acidobacteriota bacterium]MCA1638981.1 ROK family protein [Acidobacteriota bacterium]